MCLLHRAPLSQPHARLSCLVPPPAPRSPQAYVSGGGVADVVLVLARTSDSATRGLSLFAVNRVRASGRTI
jgi:hypothetical protein